MAFELRRYQRGALDALYAYWRGGGGNALIDLATGTGKSAVLGTLCKELLESFPDMRIGVATHVKELIVQNTQELISIWPQAPVGVYSAGVGRRDRHSRITMMGIQSVWNKDLGDFDLLAVDEAHLIPTNAETMYGKFISSCRARVPDMRLVGLTATPYRLGSGRLDQGDGAMFDKTVYTYGIADGVRDGYLCPLVSPQMKTSLNMNGVHVRGDFVASEVEGAAFEDNYIANTVKEIIERGHDRSGWLGFCAGVAHCHEMKEEFARNGVAVGVVTAETPSGERAHLIRAFKAQQIRCLLNVGVLTTGFNAPHLDLIFMCRPTLSVSLYVQMLGRGTRLSKGKVSCLVLDFAGNIARHGPVDAINVKTKGPGKDTGKANPEDIKAKVCPRCEDLIAIQCRTCPDCGYEFPQPNEPKHDDKPEMALPVMVKNEPPKWEAVSDITFATHARAGKTTSMRVEYLCGITLRKQWVCFEHTGFARGEAERWWRKYGGAEPVPSTVKEALGRKDEINQPSQILTRMGKSNFIEIVGVRFEERVPDVDVDFCIELDDEIPF